MLTLHLDFQVKPANIVRDSDTHAVLLIDLDAAAEYDKELPDVAGMKACAFTISAHLMFISA